MVAVEMSWLPGFLHFVALYAKMRRIFHRSHTVFLLGLLPTDTCADMECVRHIQTMTPAFCLKDFGLAENTGREMFVKFLATIA
jgi:hypothetical protein